MTFTLICLSDLLQKGHNVSDFTQLFDVFITAGCTKGAHHVNYELSYLTDV